jgi:hypothetical protein
VPNSAVMTASPSDAAAASSSEPGFRDDLRLSLSAWRAAPAMPTLTAALAALASLPIVFAGHPGAATATSFLLLPVSLFILGFRGTARVWFVRVWQGNAMSLGEVWTLSWRFLGRMLVLGLLVAIPYAAALGIFYGAIYPAGFSALTTLGIAGGISTFLLDVALTFVVPAIVFTSPSAREACRIGLRMLKEHRRHALAYLLAPPLALAVVSRLIVRATPGGAVYLIEQVVIALLDVLFKGAITAYYLRHAPPPLAPPTARSPERADATPGAPSPESTEEPPAAWRQDGTGIPLGGEAQGLRYRGRHK